ncbi:MAG: hypothetical protein EBZ53_06915 [Verrucomicrobia bacterium]|nr:hypothetical protein [Verrucomicrobiota bacterium]
MGGVMDKRIPLQVFAKRITLGLFVVFWVGLGPLDLSGAELGSSKISAVRNGVDFNDGHSKKSADVGQSVNQGQSVITKEQALAELVADDTSIIRLGANSVFSYSSKERIVKLDKGTMLMHTPPGNGGATIESGGVTGAISGTTFMLTASPAKCSECGQELQVNDAGKVICRDHPNNPPSSGGFALVVLEGSSVTKVSGPDGITVDVMPGQMAVVGPKGSGAPTVYAVNITQIARTSPLINAFPNPLPSLPNIISTAYNLQNQNIGWCRHSDRACADRRRGSPRSQRSHHSHHAQQQWPTGNHGRRRRWRQPKSSAGHGHGHGEFQGL